MSARAQGFVRTCVMRTSATFFESRKAHASATRPESNAAALGPTALKRLRLRALAMLTKVMACQTTNTALRAYITPRSMLVAASWSCGAMKPTTVQSTTMTVRKTKETSTYLREDPG